MSKIIFFCNFNRYIYRTIINVRNHQELILRKKIKFPYLLFLEFFLILFLASHSVKILFLRSIIYPSPKYITLVESRFDAVELKNQGVLVVLVNPMYRKHGPRTTRIV